MIDDVAYGQLVVSIVSIQEVTMVDDDYQGVYPAFVHVLEPHRHVLVMSPNVTCHNGLVKAL